MGRNWSDARLAGLAICSAGILLATGAAERAHADTTPVVVDYEVYAGGLHVLSSVFEVRLRDQSYNARLGAALVGMPGWFVEWGAEITSGGAIQGGQLDPARYVLDRVRRGQSQRTMLEFGGDGLIGVTFDPERSDSNALVPIELLARSLDPLSGLMSVINTVTQGGGCDATVPVFDGRRRYDLEFTDLGMDDILPSRKSPFSGEARRCRMQLQPVAGAFKNGGDDDSIWNTKPENERRRRLDVWLARPVAGGPVLPVRMVGRSSVGAVVIHMRAANASVSTADSEVPEGCTVAVTC